MKNIVTIIRRDLGYYFTSPIGYIFIIVYVLMSVGLYTTSFFVFPTADMRSYFMNLPILLCVFIPAVTMRVWAEERKENTWELLLTFPMKSRELVLGKFLATLAFYALTLAATFTIPLMLFVLGNPDNGAVFGGYLGALLMGAFFLSMGIFFSGFFKDQIVAFVVTLLVCFGVFLLGMEFIAAYLDGVVSGLGSMLATLVGVTDHYNAFTRGVIELGDLLYFLAWTAIFLMLNIMYIEGRSRPRARLTFGAAVAISMAIGLLFNWLITGQSIARWDATEDKIYTVSEASTEILASLDAPVQVKVYITPKDKMPTGMTKLEQDIVDKIEELRMAGSGHVQYSVVHLEAANVLAEANKPISEEEKKDEDKAIETRMLDKGVEPFPVQAMSNDQVTSQLVYSSIGVGYKNKKEEIIPKIMPENLIELEYKIVSTIYKLTRPKAPVVAMVAPKEAVNIDPQTRAILEQMGRPVPTSEDPYEKIEGYLRYEKYEVERVELTQDSPLPAEYDVLVVVNPRQLNDRQRWEINRALVSGKSVVMAVQQYEWDYQLTRQGSVTNKREEKPEINQLLEAYGLQVSDEILMDVNSLPLTVMSSNNPLAAMLGQGQTVNLPTHIRVNNSSMDQETSITSRLSTVFYLWGSPLSINEETLGKHGLESKVLMSTTDRAWSIPGSGTLTNDTCTPPETGGKSFPLMAMVAGQFPDAFKDQPRPAWPVDQPRPGQPPRPPREEGEAAAVTPAPGKLILLGCSEMFRNNFFQAGNVDLFLNSVDAVALGDNVVKIRSRKPIDRAINQPPVGTRRFWKLINYALASTIIAGVGIGTTAVRRRARNAYTMAQGAMEEA
ncbi:MAG TPA: Gldg family protein [Candidatus Bathyarchaeia archaeon]|nr:Gldg family protein [Candidatus Bathyarchaeia archaeon]